jgi:hypothetical protein
VRDLVFVRALAVVVRGAAALVAVLPTTRDPALTCDPSTPPTVCETVIVRVPADSGLADVIEKVPSEAMVAVPAVTPSTYIFSGELGLPVPVTCAVNELVRTAGLGRSGIPLTVRDPADSFADSMPEIVWLTVIT